MSENPNPQGKGQVPVLAALMENRAGLAPVPPKNVERVSTELFTSLFVLESDFRFKPVQGKPYWLYRKEGRFWLSVLSPQELGPSIYGRYIGEAELQSDLTWTLQLSDEAARDQGFMHFLENKRAELEERMQSAETMDDALPVHESGFAFYQRAYAFALAHSLSASMEKSGIRGLTYDEARGLIGHEREAGETR